MSANRYNDPAFTLYWLTGDKEIVYGRDIAEAFTKAGYSSGALRALDFYSSGDTTDQYTWDKDARKWVKS